jgi:hypothetical protein
MTKPQVIKILKKHYPGADSIKRQSNGTYVVRIADRFLEETHWYRVYGSDLRRIGGVEVEV